MLYPQRDHATPTQKLFRREPAITEFDKLFTPYHKSSDGFVRPTGSGLHDLLQSLHPAHGKLIPLRVVPPPYSRAIHARFHCASVGLPLRQRTKVHSPAHSSIGTPSPGLLRAPTACRHTVSGTISLPFRGAFHLSLTVLVHYRSSGVFSLGEWSPQIPTGFHVSRGTQELSRSRSDVAYGALTRYGRPFQGRSAIRPICDSYMPVLQPRPRRDGLGCSPFARRY